MIKHLISYIVIGGLFPFLAYGQIDLESSDIVVEKEFEGIIEDAHKIDIMTPGLDSKDSMIIKEYRLPGFLMHVPYEKSNLRPVAMPEERIITGYDSYIKAGFGTQLSPLIELMYNDNNIENLLFGFKYSHFSTNASKIDFQRFSKNSAGVYFDYTLDKVKMRSDFDFNRLVHHFYGKEYPDSVDRKDVRNRIQDFQLSYEIMNVRRSKSGIDYRLGIDFKLLKDERGVRDYNINFKNGISREFANEHVADLSFDVLYNNFRDQFDIESRNAIISVRPRYSFPFAGFEITGMLNGTLDDDLIYLLPYIKIQRSLYDDYLIAHIGWQKEHEQNTYRKFILENPYLSEAFIHNNSRRSKLWIGLKGSYRSFSYDLEASTQQIKRMPVFENNPFTEEEFIVTYDGNTEMQNLHADFGFQITENIEVIAGMDYNFYNTEKIPEPLHLPAFTGNFGAVYNLMNKIIFKLDVIGISKYYGLIQGELHEIKGVADVNLEVSYQFSDYLSFFATINNIASRKHERWLNYPTYGFNGLIGAKFKY